MLIDQVLIQAVPKELRSAGGDVSYLSCVLTGPNGMNISWLARDWRANKWSHHRLIDFAGHKWYQDVRRESVRRNKPRIRKTIDQLRGIHAGRPAYIVLNGPTALRDIEANPPGREAVVIGYNRAYTYCRLDYLLLADGIVGKDLLEKWGGPVGGVWPRLVACQWAHHTLREVWDHDQTFWFRTAGHGPEHFQLEVSMDLPELEYVFTGSTMTLHLADLMGCNPIRFVGANYCMTTDEHYPGSVQQCTGNSGHFGLYNSDGRFSVTTIEMFLAAVKMETWAWMLKEKYGVEVRNLSADTIFKRFVKDAV